LNEVVNRYPVRIFRIFPSLMANTVSHQDSGFCQD